MMKRKYENSFTFVRVILIATVLSILPACGGGGSGSDSDPTVDEQPVAYVQRPTPLDDNNNLVENDLKDPIEFRPGAHLIVKSSATLTANTIDITDAIIGDTGDVRDPEFNYNGTKLVFALRMEDDDMDPPETWDIYEYTVGAPLSQAPGNENPRRVMPVDVANNGEDIAPSYLPGDNGGRIVFSSTRAHRTSAISRDEGGTGMKPTIEEENSDTHALNIHVMEAVDGSNMQQLTFNPSHDLDPVMIRTIQGLEWHIMFTRWENMRDGQNGQRDQMSLYAMRPDGTQLVALYGSHSHANSGTAGTSRQFYQPHETSGGNVLVLERDFTNTQDGGDPVLIDVQNYIDNTIPADPNSSATGPAQISTSGGTISTDATLSPQGRYSSLVPLLDGTSRALASFSLCYVDFLDPADATVVLDTRQCDDALVDLTDPNQVIAAPRYGVYVLDYTANSISAVTVAAADTYFTDVAVGQGFTNAGTQLNYSFDVTNTAKRGTLHIHSVYDMDGGYNTALANASEIDTYIAGTAQGPAYFLRIVKNAYLPDDDLFDFDGSAFGLTGTNQGRTGQLMRQIVGYKQIEPDGSVRVEVPSDVPLSFSILDTNGRRIGNSLRHKSWITVRPGEEVTCHGCHDHGSGQVHGRQMASGSSISTAEPALNEPNNPTQTMAYLRTTTSGQSTSASVDMEFDDFWGLSGGTSFAYSYSELNTASPLNDAACGSLNGWYENCRSTINYESHIQPIWEFARVDSGMVTRQCTSCHGPYDAVNMQLQEPAGKFQLDLTQNSPDGGGNSVDNQDANYFKSYAELLGPDNIVEVQGAALVESLFDLGQVDGMGNPILEPDSVFGANGANIGGPILVTGNTNANNNFFEVFTLQYYNDNNADPNRLPHWDPGANAAWLTDGELKLIAEWIDIGAQYYNNPFQAPPD